MKILIERAPICQPQKLTCTICGDRIQVNSRRAMLYDDRGLIQGDVCPQCMKSKPTEIQQKLRDRALLLMHQASEWDECSVETNNRATDLFRLAQEKVKVPNIFQRCLRQVQLLSEETQELEEARRRQEGVCQRQRLHLEQLLK